ncbi:hypothetical protein ACLI4Q_07645 [Natrialbaceae archaeon A-CW1-1]
MRRIYDSRAVSRDDTDPFKPGEEEFFRPQSMRSVNGSAWSKRLIPHWVRHRAISVDVSIPQSTYESGATIPFRVTMRNRLPIPITVRTQSPLLWSWYVDDHEEASYVQLRNPPDEAGEFNFTRGERVTFRKQWSQLFRTAKREWEPAEPGTYTISVAINVDDPVGTALYDETTVHIEP